jgi:hypothetical protein
VIATHASAGVAVHWQFAEVVTVNWNDPPLAGTDWVNGDTVYEHGAGVPVWVMVSVWSAICSVAVRALADVFAATSYPTSPGPEPDWPALTLTHGALEDAAHAHCAVVVTLTLNAPPAAGTGWAGAESANVQGVGAVAPACVTVTV